MTTQSVGKGISFSFERGIQGYIDIDVSLLSPSVVLGNNLITQGLERKYPITFLSGEITYPFGTIGVSNEKVIDFSRNLVFDRLKIRGAKINYQAYNYTGISIIKTDLLKRFKGSFLKANNFEQKFYPKIIKKYQTKLLKISGFWHSIDNLKDIEIVDKKNKKSKKYLDLKRLNLFLKKSKNKTFRSR